MTGWFRALAFGFALATGVSPAPCGAGTGVVSVVKTPRVHDSASRFISFWNEAKSKGMPEQVALFKSRIIPLFPEFYNFKLEKWKRAGLDVDAEIRKALADFPKIEAAFVKKASTIAQEIEVNLEVFKRTFPDFNPDIDIYITHSLGEMDGGTREIDGKSYFIFGVDSIVKYHNAATDTPFFHHELFHVYHHQFFEGPDEIWTSLWLEGLATYVSKALNPGATRRDIMLDTPEGLVSSCDSILPYLWVELRGRLKSNSEDDYATFFFFSSTHPKIPKRAGYYLGYLIAEKMARRHGLQELRKLRGAPLLQEISEEIDGLVEVITVQ